MDNEQARKSAMGLGNTNCIHCDSVPETTLHALRYCPRAVTMWLTFVRIEMCNNFLSGDLRQQLGFNLMDANWKRDDIDWAVWLVHCIASLMGLEK